MNLVTMIGRVAGVEKGGSIDKMDGSFVVNFDETSESTHSLGLALSSLGQQMLDYLKNAWGKTKAPWGLKVSVSGQMAVYGDYPKFPGGGGVSPFAYIRERYKEGEPPMAAVRNAIQFAKTALS